MCVWVCVCVLLWLACAGRSGHNNTWIGSLCLAGERTGKHYFIQKWTHLDVVLCPLQVHFNQSCDPVQHLLLLLLPLNLGSLASLVIGLATSIECVIAPFTIFFLIVPIAGPNLPVLSSWLAWDSYPPSPPSLSSPSPCHTPLPILLLYLYWVSFCFYLWFYLCVVLPFCLKSHQSHWSPALQLSASLTGSQDLCHSPFDPLIPSHSAVCLLWLSGKTFVSVPLIPLIICHSAVCLLWLSFKTFVSVPLISLISSHSAVCLHQLSAKLSASSVYLTRPLY